MTATPPRRITLEDLMALAGTGPRTTRRLVREGRLPGQMDGTRYICSPGEFQYWVDGHWVPKTPVAPVTMIHRRKIAS